MRKFVRQKMPGTLAIQIVFPRPIRKTPSGATATRSFVVVNGFANSSQENGIANSITD